MKSLVKAVCSRPPGVCPPVSLAEEPRGQVSPLTGQPLRVFPGTALTEAHKVGSLKQQKCMVSQF